MPLYRDVMTLADRTSRRLSAAVSALWSTPAWRATGNALAAAGVAAVGGILLGGIVLIWGAALVSLIHWPVGGWAHAVEYIAAVLAGPVLALWAVQGLAALQRSRLRATLFPHRCRHKRRLRRHPRGHPEHHRQRTQQQPGHASHLSPL